MVGDQMDPIEENWIRLLEISLQLRASFQLDCDHDPVAFFKSAFYPLIQLARENPSLKPRYLEFLVESCGYYELAVARLKENHFNNVVALKEESQLACSIFVHRGDLWRYLESEFGPSEYSLCIQAYHDAWIQSNFTDGYPLNQLSVVYGYKRDVFHSLLFGMQSLAARKSCPLALQNIQLTLRKWDSRNQGGNLLEHKIVCMLISGKREYIIDWNSIDSITLLINSFVLIAGFGLFVLRQRPQQSSSSCSLLTRPILARLERIDGGISSLLHSVSHFSPIDEWTKSQLNL